jgi:hypothetical protein
MQYCRSRGYVGMPRRRRRRKVGLLTKLVGAVFGGVVKGLTGPWKYREWDNVVAGKKVRRRKKSW